MRKAIGALIVLICAGIILPPAYFALVSGSDTAELRVIPGSGHATDILESHPFIVDEIAEWIVDAMGSGAP